VLGPEIERPQTLATPDLVGRELLQIKWHAAPRSSLPQTTPLAAPRATTGRSPQIIDEAASFFRITTRWMFGRNISSGPS
jgi:hypothetical protein